jgi:hypothetical protein
MNKTATSRLALTVVAVFPGLEVGDSSQVHLQLSHVAAGQHQIQVQICHGITLRGQLDGEVVVDEHHAYLESLLACTFNKPRFVSNPSELRKASEQYVRGKYKAVLKPDDRDVTPRLQLLDKPDDVLLAGTYHLGPADVI